MSMKQLLPLVILSVSCVSSSTMSELIHRKYQEVYNPPVFSITMVNEEDVEVLYQLPLLSLYSERFLAPEFLEKLKNFESDPLPAFADKDMKMCLIFHALRDYDVYDEESGRFLSREIVTKCIEYAPDPDFILKLMAETINYDREELFDDLLDKFSALKMTQSIFSFNSNPIGDAIIQTGRFNYTKKLFFRGLTGGASPEQYACGACAFAHDARVVIDFLDFLVVRQQAFNVNDLVYPFATYKYVPASSSPVQLLPLLLILLKGLGSLAFKEAVGRWLVSIGADLNVTDEDGKDALVLSQEQGINLLAIE